MTTKKVTGASLDEITRQLAADGRQVSEVTTFAVSYVKGGNVVAKAEGTTYDDVNARALRKLGDAVALQYEVRVDAIYPAAPGPQPTPSRRATYLM